MYCLAAVPLLLVTSITEWAQPFHEFYHSFSESLTLLRLEEVQTDLRLSTEQNVKMKQVLETLKEKYHKQIRSIHDTSTEEGLKVVNQLQKEIREEGHKLIEKILRYEQYRRYQQISCQQMGFKAFTDGAIQKGLQLTDNQIKKIPVMIEDAKTKKNNLRDMTFNAYEKIDQDTIHSMITMLTNEQKETWFEMTGKTLKINRFGMLERLK